MKLLLAFQSLAFAMFGLSGWAGSPAAYDQPYRPQFHFSPREHWTNDPNGLVYFEGEYHLFFQYNPFGDKWGHMSWGHTVSTDLVHWKQLPVALPEENGIMIFTGSTVIDQKNTSGFCTGGKPCMVAVYTGYTAPGPSKPALQTQNVAYSNDRGRTWAKYTGNPVLDLHMTDFRDPKVFWSEAGGRWIMVVSLPDDHKARFYGSADLKSWKQLSDFGPAGATSGQWECPELFQVSMESESNRKKWVLKIGLNPGSLQGGSGEQYFVGEFDGTKFANDNPDNVTLWTDYGKDCYCALTFNHLPEGQPQAMIGWMNNWQYANEVPTSPWRGQMTVPRSLSLRKTPEGLRLIQHPYKGLEQLREAHVSLGDREMDAANQALAGVSKLGSHTLELHAEIHLGSAQEVGLRVLGGNEGAVVIGFDRQRHELFVDRTKSGDVGFNKDFPARVSAPLETASDLIRLDVLIDRCSVEVFAEDGRVTITNLVFPKPNDVKTEFYSNGGRSGHVSGDVWALRSIW